MSVDDFVLVGEVRVPAIRWAIDRRAERRHARNRVRVYAFTRGRWRRIRKGVRFHVDMNGSRILTFDRPTPEARFWRFVYSEDERRTIKRPDGLTILLRGEHGYEETTPGFSHLMMTVDTEDGPAMLSDFGETSGGLPGGREGKA